jgi:cation:H+ antiporter
MLSTLAFFLVGLTVTIASIKKRRKFEIRVEVNSLKRDMIFFLVMYASAILLPMFFGKVVLVPVAIALVMGYCFYAWMTFRGESAEMEHTEEMYFWRFIKRLKPAVLAKSPPLFVILIQIIAALLIMIKGAHTFVASLEQISVRFGIDPLLFALLLAPVATELPEKFNSVTWIWKGRDTLALGNITGAMVFQSTFPVSVGLLFTEWEITGMALFSAAIAITSALVVLYSAAVTKRISPLAMLFGGCLYVLYALVLIFR